MDVVHASAQNQQMVAAEVRTSAQQAVRYVTGGVVVSPSTLEPPDITIPYKNFGYEPTQVERVGLHLFQEEKDQGKISKSFE